MFSGMGADARLFSLQAMQFPNLMVPAWLPPETRETLSDYGKRMAESLSVSKPCFVGGASFGGMVALEVARHLPTKGCFLISTIRSRRELPWRYRWLTPFARLIPGVCTEVSQLFAKGVLASTERIVRPNVLSPLRVIAEEAGGFHRWAGVAALRWNPPREAPYPVFQIHGDRDPVFNSGRSLAETIVPGGGHLLPLTHPQIVNQFLKEGIEQTA